MIYCNIDSFLSRFVSIHNLHSDRSKISCQIFAKPQANGFEAWKRERWDQGLVRLNVYTCAAVDKEKLAEEIAKPCAAVASVRLRLLRFTRRETSSEIIKLLSSTKGFRLGKLGALERRLVEKGEKWRLISCIWLHGGLLHLLANMISLLCIGMHLEQEFRFLRIGALYVISGLGGSLMSCLTDSRGERVSVGASGALFGLLGAMLSELITNWTIYENKCTSLMILILIIALNLSVGFLPRVDNSAHCGGFLAGFFLGFVLLLCPQYGYVNPKYIPPGYDMKHKKSKHKRYQHVFRFTSLAILLAGFIAGYTKLLREHTVWSVPFRDIN